MRRRSLHRIARMAMVLGVLGALVPGCGKDSPTGPQPTPVAVGAALRIGHFVSLFDQSGNAFVKLDTYTGFFSAPMAPKDYEPGLEGTPVDAMTLYSVGGDPEWFVVTGGGRRLTIRAADASRGVWTSIKDIADSPLGSCPFETIGALYTEPTRMVVFEGGGHRYAYWTRSTNQWTRVFDFDTEYGGGSAPIDGVGAAYIREDGRVMLFDASGTHFTVWSTATGFTPAAGLDDLGDGSLEF